MPRQNISSIKYHAMIRMICFLIFSNVLICSAQKMLIVNQNQLIANLKEDCEFWKDKASIHLENMKTKMMGVSLKDNAVNVANYNCNQFKQQEVSYSDVEVYDDNGLQTGYRKNASRKSLSYLVVGSGAVFKNMIGFCFSNSNDSNVRNEKIERIYFANPDSLIHIKDKRRICYLKLLVELGKLTELDSSIEVGNKKESYTLQLIKLSGKDSKVIASQQYVDYLFKNYDHDFSKSYYSQNNKTYGIEEDSFGNKIIVTQNLNNQEKRMRSYYDSNGNVIYQIPDNMNMQSISLLFNSHSKEAAQKIFPGSYSPSPKLTELETSEYQHNFIGSESIKKHFSKTSQYLWNYLVEIYK